MLPSSIDLYVLKKRSRDDRAFSFGFGADEGLGQKPAQFSWISFSTRGKECAFNFAGQHLMFFTREAAPATRTAIILHPGQVDLEGFKRCAFSPRGTEAAVLHCARTNKTPIASSTVVCQELHHGWGRPSIALGRIFNRPWYFTTNSDSAKAHHEIEYHVAVVDFARVMRGQIGQAPNVVLGTQARRSIRLVARP